MDHQYGRKVSLSRCRHRLRSCRTLTTGTIKPLPEGQLIAVMIFPIDVYLWISVLVVLLGYFPCLVIAEEGCYRGDAHLDYDNPCSEQPSKLSLCPKGMRLAEPCTENCVYCDAGTLYQDTFTNCSTCLPCTTDAECPPGQVVIRDCTLERNAECGCPAPPPCPMCESCPTAPPCPSEEPCPVQTECPACECPTINAPATTTEPQHSSKLTFIRECPANVLAVVAAANRTGSVEWEEPQATGGAAVVQSHHPGDSFLVGNTTVLYLFKIESDIIYCSFVVTVIEETAPPTPPPSTGDPTEGNTPKPGFQKNSGCKSCWICWIILMGVLLVVLVIVLGVGFIHWKKNLAKDNKPAAQNSGGGVPHTQAQNPPADLELNEYGNNTETQAGNNNSNGPSADGEDDSRNDAASDTGSNRGNDTPNSTVRGAARLISSDQYPDSDLNSDLEPISGARGGTGETDPLISQPHSLPVEPAQNMGPSRMQSDQQNNRTAPLRSHSYSPSSSVEPTRHRGLSRMQSDQLDNSATPLLSQLHSLSSPVEPVQNPGPSRMQSNHLSHPEELITMEDRRGSEVTEMELRWLAKIVCKYDRYFQKHKSLPGYLNIEEGAVSRIKLEHLSNNSVNHMETEIFTVIHYGRLQRDDRTKEEDSRGHLIKQLYTFDRKLAEKYAEYINNCEDFGIMWPV